MVTKGIKIMNKKLIALLAFAAIAPSVFAHHHGYRPAPVYHHHHHDRDMWGRGGRNFWPGFIGGVVGTVAYNALAADVVRSSQPTVVVQQPAPVVVQQPAPVIVQQPVVVQQTQITPVTTVQKVWVEGRYVEHVQANGAVVRVWQPGHYEQRTVTVQ